MQNPAVPGALTDPHAVPGAQSDPQAVHVSGQDSSSTAVPTGGTNAELLSDPTREETDPSRAESARNPGSAVADTILGKAQLYTASRLYKEVCRLCMDDNIQHN